jgi:monoamine oxidase
MDVMVLEARERVGGRTWSVSMDNGAVAERGGEFIAPSDRCLRDLCRELGLPVDAHGLSFDRRCAPGQPAPTEADVVATLSRARERIAGAARDISAEAALPLPAVRSPQETSIVRRIETSLTIPLTQASARRLFGGERHAYDPAGRVRGGNQSITLALADRLGSNVRLRTPVTGLAHHAHGATVRIEGHGTVPADAVVVAVPLPLLLALELQPRLPDRVAAAAGHLAFGDAAKLHIPLGTAGQPGGQASPRALWWCWMSAAGDGQSAAPLLSAFAGGAATVRALLEQGIGVWVAAATQLWPGLRPAPGSFVTHWGADEWTRGSYSVPAVGSDAADDAAWARPWGSIVFAGEHTAGPHAATMNGAALSGHRAAQTVIELLARR